MGLRIGVMSWCNPLELEILNHHSPSPIRYNTLVYTATDIHWYPVISADIHWYPLISTDIHWYRLMNVKSNRGNVDSSTFTQKLLATQPLKILPMTLDCRHNVVIIPQRFHQGVESAPISHGWLQVWCGSYTALKQNKKSRYRLWPVWMEQWTYPCTWCYLHVTMSVTVPWKLN